jgi:hypothetical protein
MSSSIPQIIPITFVSFKIVILAYSENIKAQGEGATADDFEIFRERGKMMSQRLVKNSWNKKGVEN